MKATSLILIVLSLATMAYGSSKVAAKADSSVPMKLFIFREDCYDQFFVKKDFSNFECIKFTLSKFVGFGIIAGSSILKVPQIVKIV